MAWATRAGPCVPVRPRGLHHGLLLHRYRRSSPSEDGVEPATGGGQVRQADTGEEWDSRCRGHLDRSCMLPGWQEQELGDIAAGRGSGLQMAGGRMMAHEEGVHRQMEGHPNVVEPSAEEHRRSPEDHGGVDRGEEGAGRAQACEGTPV